MEIIKLAPAFKDYLWGGRKLVTEFKKDCDFEKVAESWELSCHKDGPSTVLNGQYKGKTFTEYLNGKGKECWGTDCKNYETFPILIKFIDAKQALSIQVHPDDEYALKNEHEYGKNEFWYVLEAEPDAFLYYGVNKEMTKDEFRASIENDTVCDNLKKVNVKKGDCFYIQAGTIHAIGAGTLIAEIQQTSNSTYRVYDFKRLGVDGKPRELHIDKAVAVANLVPNAKNGEAEGKLEVKDGYDELLLTNNNYFNCTRYDVKDAVTLKVNNNTFQGLTILEGNGKILFDNQELDLVKGDSVFVPADEGEYTVKGNISFIVSKV
ncbi:MAG: class I mannose-6-phosphate isomerase [Thomasclavelia sp.]|nr:class I mannose-6-phosphate isomerase [Thomasclavelia sp.]